MEANSLVETLERKASEALDAVADIFVGEASTLRDGTEHAGVELPRDLYAHREAQTEWWYYTGHMRTDGGARFGFELVFFKRRTDLDRFGVVPLRLLANPLYLAHFAVTDETRRTFRYGHRKSANSIFEPAAVASVRRYLLQLGDWSVREAGGLHLLHATLGEDLVFEAALRPTKPAALNGHERTGVSFKDRGEASRYFSYTRMAAEGHITWSGRTERFEGSAWMDREFGTWRTTEGQKGWDWFALQLSTGAELMAYQIRDREGRASSFSSGTYVSPEGESKHLAREDFQIEVLSTWRSPRTGATYPSGWRLCAPSVGIDVTITPVLDDQELDTRGTTMIVYWEGACRVEGRHGDATVEGRAYVELVGYDRSHETPSLTTFLFGDSLDRRWRSIFG
ncbi:MAG TPA: lipocalin family protein [Pyrinomonadaceae bacterium]|nr:lipocalin family protein [Pyrinomonadaceae bacterium]